MYYVPVISQDGKLLMPTRLFRARQWLKSGKATGFIKKGVFCIQLCFDPSDNQTQAIALGIDPGSKKEGLTVKSASHTYLNIQADAVTHVKKAVEQRRNARRARRCRKTPCRQPRWNRKSLFAVGRVPPSTKSRWQWKLRLISWLSKMYPITIVVVEDIKAKTKKSKKKWNKSFSPLQVGKSWFYDSVRDMGFELILKEGHETHAMRELLGLKKSKDKLSNTFDAHCVDSWVLSHSVFNTK